MSVASPATSRSNSRSSIEISPELKPRDLNVLLKNVERTGSSEIFLYAKEGKVFMTSDHTDILNRGTERSDKMLSLIKKSLSKTSQSTNINDVFLDIRKFAKSLKTGKHECGVRKESTYVAVGTRQLSGLLSHRHDPLSQEQREQRQQVVDDAIMESMKSLHVLCAAHAAMERDDDHGPLLEMARPIGRQIADSLVNQFHAHYKHCGKHELALFRMSFLTEYADDVKNAIRKLCKEQCSHELSVDLLDVINQGLQQSVGNVTTDGKLVASENEGEKILRTLRLDDRKFSFGDSAGKGAHGSVNIYRSTSGTAFSVAVKSPLAQDEDARHTLATCQRELGRHLQAQGIGHENVVEVMGALRSGDMLHIMMEDCSLGSLDGYRDKRLAAAVRNGDITPAEHRLITLTLARDVLAGLHHLHDTSNVLHLDMKPGNVFIGIDGKAKIGDFDRSLKGNAVPGNIRHVPDTAQYVSPRLLNEVSKYRQAVNRINDDEAAKIRKASNKDEKKLIYKAARQAREALDTKVTMNRQDDVYAAGATLFELLYGSNPFLDTGTGTGTIDNVEAYANAREDQRRYLLFDGRTLPAGLRADEAAIQNLLLKMLAPLEDKRTSAADALGDTLFADPALGTPEVRSLIRNIGGLA